LNNPKSADSSVAKANANDMTNAVDAEVSEKGGYPKVKAKPRTKPKKETLAKASAKKASVKKTVTKKAVAKKAVTKKKK